MKILLTVCRESIVDINPEVLDALTSKRPVVALESTIITHGMPRPHNLATAIEVEEIVRQQVIAFIVSRCSFPFCVIRDCRQS